MTTLVVFVCRSIVFKIFGNTKSAFSTFLFVDQFQPCIFHTLEKSETNLWDMVLEAMNEIDGCMWINGRTW